VYTGKRQRKLPLKPKDKKPTIVPLNIQSNDPPDSALQTTDWRRHNKTEIGQFFCNKEFMEDISRNGNLKMVICRIPEKDRIRMKELHERGLSLIHLFRMIIKNDVGTLAERIYCFYAIDYFISVDADSRIKPTRGELDIVCDMGDQFPNETTLKDHCGNRDLIDFIDIIKAREGSFCAGGLKFMAPPFIDNLKSFGKESTLECQSMLIYAHHLITGEFQPMEKGRPNTFDWFDLFRKSGEEIRE
jgi:hypothetical protein